MIKVIDYDPSIIRCDPPKKIRYNRTDFIADIESDISAMNSSNSKYLNYPAGSSVLCLGNGKRYILNSECNEYLEFKDGGSARTKANLYRSMVLDNGKIFVTLNDEVIHDGINVLSIGDTVTITVTADSGYQVKSITLNGEIIENGSEITVEGDITLIAEFEEAPAPSGYTWNGTDTSEHDIEGANLQHYIGEAPSYSKADYIGAIVVRKLDEDETEYVLTDDDITEYEQDDMYALQITCDEHSSVAVARGVEGMTDGLYFVKELEGDIAGQYTASLILSSHT